MGECKEEYDDYQKQEKNKKRTGCVIAAVIVFVLLSMLFLQKMYSFLYPVFEEMFPLKEQSFLKLN